DDLLSVWREERAAVVAFLVRQTSLVLSVRVHDVNLAVAIAEGTEDDLRPIRRIGGFRIVAGRVGQPHEIAAIEIGFENVEVLIEVPTVAPRSLRLLDLLFLFGFAFGVEMRAGEKQARLPGMEERAGGLAFAGRDALCSAVGKIHRVDLVEWIARL